MIESITVSLPMLQPPEWFIWIIYGLTMYLFLSIFPFGCRFCGLPDLAWGPKLVFGAVSFVLWRMNLWPERLTEYCDGCADPINPNERQIRYYSQDHGHKKFCSNKCCDSWKEEFT